MRNRSSQYPGRYLMTDPSTGETKHVFLTLDDAPTVPGTDLSAQNLLSDATAALLGLVSEDPTVDEALAALSRGAGNAGGQGGYYAVCASGNAAEVKEVNVPDMGRSPQVGDRLTILFRNGNSAVRPSLRVAYGDGGDVSDAVRVEDTTAGGNPLFWQWDAGAAMELVYTSERRGGITYYQWNVVNPPNYYSAFWWGGNYTGNGTYGSANAVSLTPGSGSVVLGMIHAIGSTDFCLICGNTAIAFADGVWDAASVNVSNNGGYYSTAGAAAQMNKAGVSYAHAAIVARA